MLVNCCRAPAITGSPRAGSLRYPKTTARDTPPDLVSCDMNLLHHALLTSCLAIACRPRRNCCRPCFAVCCFFLPLCQHNFTRNIVSLLVMSKSISVPFCQCVRLEGETWKRLKSLMFASRKLLVDQVKCFISCEVWRIGSQSSIILFLFWILEGIKRSFRIQFRHKLRISNTPKVLNNYSCLVDTPIFTYWI